jgi:hypothetical protein
MEITTWEPPRRCEVRHTGRVVRGTAAFREEEPSAGRSRFVWEESLQLPFGRLGRWTWPLVRPRLAAGGRGSVRRFARSVASVRP